MKIAIHVGILILAIAGFLIGSYKSEVKKKNLEKVNSLKLATILGISCGAASESLSILLAPIFTSEVVSFIVPLVIIVAIWTLCALLAKWIVNRKK